MAEKKEFVNTQFVIDCMAMEKDAIIKRETVTYDELFNLKYPAECDREPGYMLIWGDFEIHAITTIEYDIKGKKYPPGTKVRVWAVSRMGDIGVTANLKNPCGYDLRTEDIKNFKDWEIKRHTKSNFEIED